jgi:hypothetical protein
MATQNITIAPVSVSPTASQISLSSQDVFPDSKKVTQYAQSKSNKDLYAGSTMIDLTYSNLAKNTIKPKATDIIATSTDVVQSKDNVFQTQDSIKVSSRASLPRQSDISPKTTDVSPSTKEIRKQGDVRFKIVKDISKEVEKTISEWNKYNLSKSNRLLKSIDFEKA